MVSMKVYENARLFGDREKAILIIDGEVYISDFNHQEALMEYFLKHNIKTDFDPDNSDSADKTYTMFENHEMYGFDVYDDYDDKGWAIIAHDKETLNANIEWIKAYAKEYNYIVGYFKEYLSFTAVIVDI